MEIIFEKIDPLTEPKVTIGMCVRDCESSVGNAIEGVSNQDFPRNFMEVIIVDDGSEDRTLNFVLSLASKVDMQVRVLHQEWRGIGPARNVVLNNAQGDYIIWVDGDMILPKDHVKKQVEFMKQNPKIGIAKAKHRVMPKENLIAFLEHVPYLIYDATPGILSSKPPGTGGAIYRVSAIRQAGGFDDNLRFAGEDQDAAYRVKSLGWLIEHSPAVFHERRVQTLKSLWKKYIGYGYGNHALYNKNRKVFSIFRMNPIAGFITGIVYGFIAYRLTKCKSLILLPLHFVLKMSAWCFGFTKARIDYIARNGM